MACILQATCNWTERANFILTSELYSNERTYSTSLCARHRQLKGMSHLSQLWLCTQTLIAKRVLCMTCIQATCNWTERANFILTSELYSNERTYSTSLCARHRQLKGMSHLSQLWLCTQTLMAKRVLCMACIQATCNWTERANFILTSELILLRYVHATDSWREWAISLNCDCAHKLSLRNVCCVWHVHRLHAVGRKERTLF